MQEEVENHTKRFGGRFAILLSARSSPKLTHSALSVLSTMPVTAFTCSTPQCFSAHSFRFWWAFSSSRTRELLEASLGNYSKSILDKYFHSTITLMPYITVADSGILTHHTDSLKSKLALAVLHQVPHRNSSCHYERSTAECSGHEIHSGKMGEDTQVRATQLRTVKTLG